jgi:carbamoyl-phosphate synthase small subunit
MKHAVFVLEDGTVWRGRGFGAEAKVSGEFVFNTGMVGYVQSITDPSFYGQIVCQTYPLIGNYGVSSEEWESDGPKIRGYVVSELCRYPSHHSSELSLDDWLNQHNIPGIEDIDTRELTKTIRIKGTMLGVMQTSSRPIDPDSLRQELKSIRDPNATDLVRQVTTPKIRVFHPGPSNDLKKLEKPGGSQRKPHEYPRVIVIDCGIKNNIIRSLLARSLTVVQVPATSTAARILSLEPDGIVISNGPGDPKKIPAVIQTVKNLLEEKIPLFGICLGHQVLALALGCDTYKLKFGHRGQNHPVADTDSGKNHITSQNHGFAVCLESIKSQKDILLTFLNCNDDTVEGIAHKTLPVFGVQFHPEAAPGPQDTGFLFDTFKKMIGEYYSKNRCPKTTV